MAQDLARAGMVAIFGMVIGLIPLGVAMIYMIRPTERLLGLMRPLSLATIFAAIQTLLAGFAGTFRTIPSAMTATGYDIPRIMQCLTESVAPMFVAFGCLAAAWLCVAVGMRRQP